jgi:preprotein translocase subunit SecB
MRRSPLQVETYFLRELSFKANEDYDEEKPTEDSLRGFQYFTDFVCYDKEAHKWQYVLGLRLLPVEGDNPPYFFRIVLIGYFTAEGEVPSREAEEKLIHASAPALLYTIAREILSSTSARARWGRINLPTVYFPAATSAELKKAKKSTVQKGKRRKKNKRAAKQSSR